MKYIATITPTGSPVGTGHTYEIDIDEGGMVRVDDKEYRTNLCRISDLDLYSLLLNDRSFEIHIQETNATGFRVMISSKGYEGYEVEVVDERIYRLGQSRGGFAAVMGEATLKAPIPGLVVKVLVEEGQEVAAGHSLVILEAMKMENELRAQRAGTVTSVKVSPGDSVNQGEVLITLA